MRRKEYRYFQQGLKHLVYSVKRSIGTLAAIDEESYNKSRQTRENITKTN